MSKSARSAFCWLMLLAGILVPVCAFGQLETASLSGHVLDPSEAVVVNAKVEATHTDTNTTFTTYTNRDGVYVFPSLRPGRYRLTVSSTGFKTVTKVDLILHVQDQVAQNFSLPVGPASESVTVTAGGELINTESATVSTVVDRQFAENLPMNGRSFQALIELTPGVVLTASNVEDGGQFSVNGQRAASNYWMVDGVSANIGIAQNSFGIAGNGLAGALGSFSALGGTNSLVSVDAMQEFRIQTSTYAPEFGRTPGGQISIVTRSGTNQFHGTAFDYLRNDKFDASNWFNGFTNNPPLPKAEERQNDFGGTFSGPIWRDRTFFFFSYEGLRLRLPQTTLTSVPDTSGTPGGLGARQNATVAMQPFLNAFPLPNGPEIFAPCTPNVNGCPASGQSPTGAAQFNASYSNPANLDAYSLRVDHRINDRLNLFGRYNYSPSEIALRGNGSSLSTINTTRVTTQTATVGDTWTIAPTIANDLRFNYSRTNASSHLNLDNFGGAVSLASLPFPDSLTSQNGLFQLQIFSLQQGIYNVGNQGQNLQRQINVVDSLSVQRGSHSLKFGVDFRRLSPRYGPPTYEQEPFFLDVPSAQKGSLLLTGLFSNLSPTFLFRNLGIYGQDTWRMTSRLTLTYGLRWDVDFVPQSLSGPNFNAVTGFNLNNLSDLALAPAGTPPYKTTYGNFAPRFGLAYQLTQNQSWQTVLRGGFGVFYDLATSEMGNETFSGAYPLGSQSFPFGGTFPLSPATAAPPPLTPPNATNFEILFAVNPNLKQPYTLEWNGALEQALGRQQTISISYIGAAGRRLLQTPFIFSPNSNIGFAELVTNVGKSDYHALQVQFQRRLSRGLQALASYAWSHSLDTGSAGSIAVSSNLVVPSAVSANRGASDFDIRNAFSAGLTYDVPIPKTNAFVQAILGRWSMENFILARSAPPVDISDANLAFVSQLNGFKANIRPDLVPGQPLYLYGSQYPGGKALNPAAFMNPPVNPTGFPSREGNLGRNALRGFGAAQWDLAVHRDFPIHESLKLQFRAEMFNVLNHPNFGPPNAQFGRGGFGLSTQMLGQSLAGTSVGSGGFSPLYQIGGPRSIQLALKLQF